MTRESPFCKRDEIADSPTHLSPAFLARCQFIILGGRNPVSRNPVSVHHSCAKRRADTGLRTPDYARKDELTPDYVDTGLRAVMCNAARYRGWSSYFA